MCRRHLRGRIVLLAPPLQSRFDLSRVDFVDSSGCGAIVAALSRARSEGAELALCGVRSPVRTLFDLIRLPRLVDIYDDRTQAFARMTK